MHYQSSVAFFFFFFYFFLFLVKRSSSRSILQWKKKGKKAIESSKIYFYRKKKKRKTYLNNLERSLLPLNFNNQPYTNGKRKKSNTIKEDRKTPSRINDCEGENVNFCKTRALLGPEHRHQKGKWWFYIMLANIFCTNQLSSM